jgi:integrase
MAKRRRKWSYTAGKRPYRVRVYERRPGGPMYAAVWDPTDRGGEGAEIRRSLGHCDRDEATRYADEQAAKIRKGLEQAKRALRPTAGRVLGLYRAHRTPDKGPRSREEDDRQIELWRRVLGNDFDLSKLSRREWDGFKRRRACGETDARGRFVADPEKRQRVRDRVVQKDLAFLRAAINWATRFREGGQLLMESDPTRGLELPKEKNPNRPVATHDRIDAIRKVYREVGMRIEWGRKREKVESYLPEIFEIVVGTGRRISPVCKLRSDDLSLDRTEATPWGAIVWPEDTDKMGKRWRCPIGPQTRKAIESALRKRRHVGSGWLFPSPNDPREPLSIDRADSWLRKAEEHAKLEPHEGSLWHAYRRLWASARKDLPDVDVAQTGGWSSLEALKRAYQQPDNATMLKVVTHQAELREVK